MPLLTLTSDIGEQDFLTAAMKGQLLQINSSFTLIDITHSLLPFSYAQTAYICKSAIKNFPPGTFHLIIANIFNEKPEQLLIAEINGQFIGCADNGLLHMLSDSEPQKIVALSLENEASVNTLSCINIFGKAFDAIFKGKALEQVGKITKDVKVKNALRPLLGADWIEGQIIFIDNFENVVVNISREEFEEQRDGRSFTIVFKRDEVIDKISETYADVPEGEKLALFNSAGYLEIAINKGNAAGLFGLLGYSENQQHGQSQFNNNRLIYQTVRVFFNKSDRV